MDPFFTVESADDPAEETPPVVDLCQRLYVDAAKAAESPINLLIRGEAGVGKKTLARWIHRRSGRARGPLVTINCATTEDHGIDKALFGSSRTATREAFPGAFELANGGTAILDGVDALGRLAQAKILRVIEGWQVLRIGELNARRIDVRFVATTSEDLEAAAHVMEFRLDLLHRLTGFVLTLPPLRDRPPEIESLTRRFLADVTEDGRSLTFSSTVRDLFRSVAWPRNVAQLREVVANAHARCKGSEITVEHVDAERLRNETPIVPKRYEVPVEDSSGAPDLTPAELHERARIIAALSETKGNSTRVAASLGMPRRTLIEKLDRYLIPRPRAPEKTSHGSGSPSEASVPERPEDT